MSWQIGLTEGGGGGGGRLLLLTHGEEQRWAGIRGDRNTAAVQRRVSVVTTSHNSDTTFCEGCHGVFLQLWPSALVGLKATWTDISIHQSISNRRDPPRSPSVIFGEGCETFLCPDHSPGPRGPPPHLCPSSLRTLFILVCSWSTLFDIPSPHRTPQSHGLRPTPDCRRYAHHMHKSMWHVMLRCFPPP